MPDPSLLGLLDSSSWARTLTPEQRTLVENNTVVKHIAAGGFVCSKGESVDHWIGIVKGLVKMASISADGKPTTFTGIRDGGWFGEGSLLKDEMRRYDIVALRETTAAYVTRAAFLQLLDESVGFNRFLVRQFNERLGQFIALVEHDRMLDGVARVARSVAWLFNPVLNPRVGASLDISQEEVGQLAGVSRQVANRALQILEAEGLLSPTPAGLKPLDLAGLARYGE